MRSAAHIQAYARTIQYRDSHSLGQHKAQTHAYTATQDMHMHACFRCIRAYLQMPSHIHGNTHAYSKKHAQANTRVHGCMSARTQYTKIRTPHCILTNPNSYSRFQDKFQRKTLLQEYVHTSIYKARTANTRM